MKNMFISDLHLEPESLYIVDLFIDFLLSASAKSNNLFILGDFFEVWIGDDDNSPFNQKVVSALQKATQQGLKIHIMHGNRDFLLGKRFFRETGCQRLPDEYVINLAGRPTLLMHGDTLCTADLSYLRFRKKTRNWFVQKLFLLKPLRKRQEIAMKMRAASMAHTQTVTQEIMDVTLAEVERVMSKHCVQDLIHGHTHRPAVHHFPLNDKPATRTVLAPWHKEGYVLVYDSEGNNDLLVLR